MLLRVGAALVEGHAGHGGAARQLARLPRDHRRAVVVSVEGRGDGTRPAVQVFTDTQIRVVVAVLAPGALVARPAEVLGGRVGGVVGDAVGLLERAQPTSPSHISLVLGRPVNLKGLRIP